MRKLLLIAICASIFACCAPYTHYFDVEVYDDENTWELDLKDRTPAVFALYNKDAADSVNLSRAVEGLAQRLEADRQMEAGAIKGYSIPDKDFSGFLTSTDYDSSFLNNLMLSTSADLQLFLQDLEYDSYIPVSQYDYNTGFEQIVMIPYNVHFVVYDALVSDIKLRKIVKDTIYFRCDPTANIQDLYRESIKPRLPEVSYKIGESIAQILSKQWRTQERAIITIHGSGKWSKASELALDFKWREAINIWLPLTNSQSPKKAAYAAYNIAVACEMIDEFALAGEWIDFALNKYKFQQAVTFKKYLQNRLEK